MSDYQSTSHKFYDTVHIAERLSLPYRPATRADLVARPAYGPQIIRAERYNVVVTNDGYANSRPTVLVGGLSLVDAVADAKRTNAAFKAAPWMGRDRDFRVYIENVNPGKRNEPIKVPAARPFSV